MNPKGIIFVKKRNQENGERYLRGVGLVSLLLLLSVLLQGCLSVMEIRQNKMTEETMTQHTGKPGESTAGSGQDPADPNAEILLVNKTHPLDRDYVPENLTKLTCKTVKEEWLVDAAATAVARLMDAMDRVGIRDVLVTSAYRSYERQETLFYGYIEKEKRNNPLLSESEARAIVLQYSAEPGTSEHQSGLCVDFITEEMSGVLDERFAESDAFRYLITHAHLFGFILRYPADKVEVTGYSYEPWHYRYVGVAAATEIYQKGLCLEEYLQEG